MAVDLNAGELAAIAKAVALSARIEQLHAELDDLVQPVAERLMSVIADRDQELDDGHVLKVIESVPQDFYRTELRTALNGRREAAAAAPRP